MMEELQKQKRRKVIKIVLLTISVITILLLILVLTGKVSIFTKGSSTNTGRSSFINLGSLLPKKKEAPEGIIPGTNIGQTENSTENTISQNLGPGSIQNGASGSLNINNQIPQNTSPNFFSQIFSSLFSNNSTNGSTSSTSSGGVGGNAGKNTQCSDGIDNDGDRLIDMADPGCSSDLDNDESDTVPSSCDQIPDAIRKTIPRCNPGSPTKKPPVFKPSACSDGIDNDGDKLIDLKDPGCKNQNDNDEGNAFVPSQCSDGIDNDGNGAIDMNDPGCASPNDDDESGAVPDLVIGASPTTVYPLQFTTLTWTSPTNTDFKSCSATLGKPGWSGVVDAPNTKNPIITKTIQYNSGVVKKATEYTFGINCTTTTNKKISATTKITYEAMPLPDKIVLEATPKEVAKGDTVTLSWSSPTNTTFTSCKGVGAGLDWANKILTPLTFAGETQSLSFISVPSLTTQYVISCTNSAGQNIAAQAIVKITKSTVPNYDPCKDPNASKINIICPIDAQPTGGAVAAQQDIVSVALSTEDQAIIDDLLRKYSKIAPDLQNVEDSKEQISYYENIVKTALDVKGQCEERIKDTAWWNAVDRHAIGRMLNPYDGGNNWERYPIPFGLTGLWNQRRAGSAKYEGRYEVTAFSDYTKEFTDSTYHTLGGNTDQNKKFRDSDGNYGKSFKYPFYTSGTLAYTAYGNGLLTINDATKKTLSGFEGQMPYTDHIWRYAGTYLTSVANTKSSIDKELDTDYLGTAYFNDLMETVECWGFTENGFSGTCTMY